MTDHFVLTATRDAALPMLAWVAEVDPAGRVALRCGHGVEVGEGFFVEGVWDGPFAASGFYDSSAFFGTGGLLRPDGVGFAASIAIIDWIFEATRPGRVVVSNSLPLLLATLGERLDPRAADFARINDSITDGIDVYADTLPTETGAIRRHIHRNLLVRDGRVEVVAKALPPSFDSFESYRALLTSAAAALADNAGDAARQFPLPLYTTQSSGYDSTCNNTLMAPHGIAAAFTITTGRGNGAYSDSAADVEADDDGTPIAAALGIPAEPLDRRAFEAGIPLELLFWAGMHRNRDFNYVGIHQRLTELTGGDRPVVLMGGVFGEIWYPSDVAVDRFQHPFPPGAHIEDGGLRQRDTAHCGLAEVRLAVGYIQLGMAFIGARRRPDIVAISNSESMRPWRCVPGYDRPIPRRIVEEAGVPRGLFGQIKRGSVIEFTPPEFPRDPALNQEYRRYLRRNRLASPLLLALMPLVHRWNSWVILNVASRYIYCYYLTRIWQRLTRTNRPLPQFARHLDGVIFCFANNRLADGYASGA